MGGCDTFDGFGNPSPYMIQQKSSGKGPKPSGEAKSLPTQQAVPSSLLLFLKYTNQ